VNIREEGRGGRDTGMGAGTQGFVILVVAVWAVMLVGVAVEVVCSASVKKRLSRKEEVYGMHEGYPQVWRLRCMIGVLRGF